MTLHYHGHQSVDHRLLIYSEYRHFYSLVLHTTEALNLAYTYHLQSWFYDPIITIYEDAAKGHTTRCFRRIILSIFWW